MGRKWEKNGNFDRHWTLTRSLDLFFLYFLSLLSDACSWFIGSDQSQSPPPSKIWLHTHTHLRERDLIRAFLFPASSQIWLEIPCFKVSSFFWRFRVFVHSCLDLFLSSYLISLIFLHFICKSISILFLCIFSESSGYCCFACSFIYNQILFSRSSL